MVETITEAEPVSEVDELHHLASVVINEHTNDDELCAVAMPSRAGERF